MRRYPPSVASFCLLCALISSACGRLGFEAHSETQGVDPDGDDGLPGDGDGDGDGDGQLPGDDGGDGDGDGDGDPTDDAGSGDGPTDDGGTTLPLEDAGPLDLDAGSEPDAAPLDPLAPLPATIDCASYGGVLACDPFGGATGGAAVTTFEYGQGQVQVGPSYVTMTSGADGDRAAVEARFGPFTSGAVYMRFSLYVPASLTIRGLNIANIGDLDTDLDFGVDVNLETSNAIEFYATGDGSRPSDTFSWPRDQWLCVLFKIESIDHTSGTARLEVDGQQVLGATSIDTEPANGVRGAAAGIDWTYDGQGTSALYLKNFLVTRTHPGNCP